MQTQYPMKATTYTLSFCVLFIFCTISNSYAQDQVTNTVDLPFQSELKEGFAIISNKGEFLAGKSYSWLKEFAKDYHPNRFKNELWLEIGDNFKVGLQASFDSDAILRIFTANGELIQEENQSIKKGINRFPIDASTWEAGGYIVQIESANGDVLKKVIKN